MEKIVEICTGSYLDALSAYKGGAKRIELNSALALGGLTPSLSSLILTKENTDLKEYNQQVKALADIGIKLVQIQKSDFKTVEEEQATEDDDDEELV